MHNAIYIPKRKLENTRSSENQLNLWDKGTPESRTWTSCYKTGEGCPQCSSSPPYLLGRRRRLKPAPSLLQTDAAVTRSMWEGKWQITMLAGFLQFGNCIRYLPTLYKYFSLLLSSWFVYESSKSWRTLFPWSKNTGCHKMKFRSFQKLGQGEVNTTFLLFKRGRYVAFFLS